MHASRSDAARTHSRSQVTMGLPADSNESPEVCSWSLSRRGHLIEAGFGRGHHFPQYVAFHVDSGFLRLNGGPGSDWGTSIVVLPSFWAGGRYHQGGPISVGWQASLSSLILSFSGSVSSLLVYGEVHLRQPETDGIACDICVQVEGDVTLDSRQGEAFKPVCASSMHVSSELWDVESILIDSRRFAIPEGGWIVEPVAKGRRIVLNGGSCQWKRRAPSLEIELDDCMETAGWTPARIRTMTTSAFGPPRTT